MATFAINCNWRSLSGDNINHQPLSCTLHIFFSSSCYLVTFSHFGFRRWKLFLSFFHFCDINQHDFHFSTTLEKCLTKRMIRCCWLRSLRSLRSFGKISMWNIIYFKYSLRLLKYANQSSDFWAILTHCAISIGVIIQFWCFVCLFVVSIVEFVGCYDAVGLEGKNASVLLCAVKLHSVWKSPRMSYLYFSILAFSTKFCPIKTDLFGNTVWPQASGCQKLAEMGPLLAF